MNDADFPNGGWTGFFLQWILPGRCPMNMDINFHAGHLQGAGADRVGAFTVDGEYESDTGSCRWTKRYLGKHTVKYEGVNDGHGIRGVWEIRLLFGLYVDRGAFHIWPVGMTPSEEADLTEMAMRANGPKLYQCIPGIGLLGALLAIVAVFFLLRFTGLLGSPGASWWPW